MVAPTGEQYEISAAGYAAVVTECGAGLRSLSYDGRPLVDGYPEDEPASSGRGQLLVPWPNRIEDGRYSFGDRDLQLPVTEVARHNASHGLVRWVSWALEERTERSVSLLYRLMSQPGYPWTLDLEVLYDLSADGLTVTVTASNLSTSAAPFAQGAHPYLTVGDGLVDDWELTVPARSRLAVDPDRRLPLSREDVDGTSYDFRVTRPVRGLPLDHPFTGLTRDEEGRAAVQLRHPRTGRGVALWMDRAHGWVQVYTGDDLGDRARTSLAVEPMTAGPNAFRTGEDLTVLGPAGSADDTHSASWGLHVL